MRYLNNSMKLQSILKQTGLCRNLLLAVGVFAMFACSRRETYQYTEGKVYGTFYHISYASTQDLQAGIRQEMERVNASLSMFNPASVISRINRNESDTVDSLFIRMYSVAKQVNSLSGGLYDITIAPLANAWGFGFEKEAFPNSLRIDSLRMFVGMEKLHLEGKRLTKQFPEMELDASSIAKGLGVDLVAEYLENKGVENYMVEIGGEIRAKGMSSKKRPWRIGIDRPEDDIAAQNRQLQLVLGISSGAVATSGNYRNFYMHEGKKYAHTINPLTGYPVQTEILGATVYAPSCMEADAYATAFMLTGFEKAKNIITANPALEACLIYEKEGVLKTWVSDGLQDKVVPATD